MKDLQKIPKLAQICGAREIAPQQNCWTIPHRFKFGQFIFDVSRAALLFDGAPVIAGQ